MSDGGAVEDEELDMKTLWRLVMCAGFMAACVVGPAAQTAPMKASMQRKLEDTQGLLRAVVMSDFAQVARSTERLSRISDTEIASWQTPGQPEYTVQAMAFITSVDALRLAARRKDADAVGEHYARLVSSCVRCHAVVRRLRLISLTR